MKRLASLIPKMSAHHELPSLTLIDYPLVLSSKCRITHVTYKLALCTHESRRKLDRNPMRSAVLGGQSQDWCAWMIDSGGGANWIDAAWLHTFACSLRTYSRIYTTTTTTSS